MDPSVPRTRDGYRPDITSEEPYARASMVADREALVRCTPFAVHNRITRAVWAINPSSWASRQAPGENVRWAFEGVPAAPEVHDAFVGSIGRRVPARLRPVERHRILAHVGSGRSQ